MEGTYEMVKKNEPKYDPKYSYGNTLEDKFRGVLIFEIRVHIWWHIGLKRCVYHLLSKGCPYISVETCCRLLIEKRDEMRKKI